MAPLNQCRLPRCGTPVFALGLCQRHYKQQRTGRLRDPHEPQVGSSAGHGQYGILERDEDSVLCHECGRRLQSLAWHLRKAHEMTAEDYRQAYGLGRSQELISLGLLRRYSQAAISRVGTSGWRRFEAARDPVAASRTRDLAAPSPAAVWAKRTDYAPANLPRRTRTTKVCPQCGNTYTGSRRTCSPDCATAARRAAAQRQSDRQPRLTETQRDELRSASATHLPVVIRRFQTQGITSADIGSILGRSGAWMTAHYPRTH